MPTGAAGRDVDLLSRFEFCFRDLHLVQKDVACFLRDAAKRRVTNGAGLLVNFLQHEMLEPAFFGHDRVPGDMLQLTNDGLTVEVGELYSLGGDHRQVAVGKKEEVAGVIEDCGYIRGDEILIFAKTDYCGGAVSGSDDLIGLIYGHHCQSEDAAQLTYSLSDCVFE